MNWSRKDLKAKAKEKFIANYWRCVLIGIIITFLAGGAIYNGGGSANFSNGFSNGFNAAMNNKNVNITNDGNVSVDNDKVQASGDDGESVGFSENGIHISDGEDAEVTIDKDGVHVRDDDEVVDVDKNGVVVKDGDDNVNVNENGVFVNDGEDDVKVTEDGVSVNGHEIPFKGLEDLTDGAIVMIVICCVIVLTIIILIASAFVATIDALLVNPFRLGCDRFFLKNLDEPAKVSNLGYGFDSNYKNIVKILFFKDMYVFLWSLLLIVPGIVKGYEYMMIPYLLAENPEMTKEEAFAESKRMMTGQKWNAFVLDLSFIGWYILSGFTAGLLSTFFVNPYKHSSHAALYETLKYGYNNTEVADM